MNQKRSVLIFSTVWPEPQSSAAGVRLMHWVNFFRRQGDRVLLSSPSQIKEKSEWGYFEPPSGVELLPLSLNQSETTEVLRGLKPDVILFDRFILEEQFGHHVYEACPDAVILLETQDLHLVRRAREPLRETWLSTPKLEEKFYHTDTAIRETASIYRSDLSFVVSSYEAILLDQEFDLGEEWVRWLPFQYEIPILPDSSAWNEDGFETRSGFSWVGNFRHPPNVDGLRWFRSEIWPLVRKALPTAKVSVWGAYPPSEVMQFHDPKKGFFVFGHAENLEKVFEGARVNLAPLRFGAGIKGKILEGFRRGVPVVSTSVGTEGLSAHASDLEAFDTIEEFADACIELHENKTVWLESQNAGRRLMERVHSALVHEKDLESLINTLVEDKKHGKLPRWWSRIGRHEMMNSRRYFSKWIELKERK